MIFRQLFDRETCTYTYLLADKGEAVLIDSVLEQVNRDAQFIEELGLCLKYTLETHIHADHVTGAGELRARIGCKAVVATSGGAEGVDIGVSHGDKIHFGGRYITVRATPGHTVSCVTYVLDDQSMAFTGDALMVRGCGRTDFQGGSAVTLFQSVHSQILSLPEDCALYPGHDYKGRTQTTVREERTHNPRLGGSRTLEEFIEIMDNLNLAQPARIDVAVPANRRCGMPAHG
jgi:glyoxylase-like metal-dependent hydrolase (beta-lactamase superfamily II)